MDEKERLEFLTHTERHVLVCLMQGQTIQEQAARRYVAISTVRSQAHAVLYKLGVNSQIAAIAVGHRAGLDWN